RWDEAVIVKSAAGDASRVGRLRRRREELIQRLGLRCNHVLRNFIIREWVAGKRIIELRSFRIGANTVRIVNTAQSGEISLAHRDTGYRELRRAVRPIPQSRVIEEK